ncbi:MAG: GMC oxidoreductase [Parvularculaceae bacterium]
MRPLPVLFLSGVFAALAAGTLIYLAVTPEALGEGETATITLKPGAEYQTMRGWEATTDIAEGKQRKIFFGAKDAILDSVVNDVGINRVRLEIKSGSENTTRVWRRYMAGELDVKAWRALRYATVNDNDDPNVINWAGYDFAQIDEAIDDDVLPIRERLAARGEKLFVNLCYVAFTKQITDGAYIHDDPEEYAEFVLATYLHLQKKYGLVPDTWEVILEPDLVPQWTPRKIGESIVAAARRLKENGFTPRFVIPSVTDTANVTRFLEGIAKVKGAMQYVAEISYHRYRNATRNNVETVAVRGAQYKKPTSMLELWFGRANSEVLFEDLTVGNASAFQGRTVLGNYDLSFSSDGKPQFALRKEVVENSQVYRFVRMGAVRLGAESTRPLNARPVAFRNPNGGVVVAVLVARPSSLVLKDLPAGRYSLSYAHGGQRVVEPNPLVVTAGGDVRFEMPVSGVVTFAALPDEAGVKVAVTQTDIVVGSGPAGVAAAHALLARGRRVKMVDIGGTLEPDLAVRRSRMAETEPSAWARVDIEAATLGRRTNRSDVMRPFGSDFPVRDTVDFFDGSAPPHDLALRPSFALGGLSNGWGAAVLPYKASDLVAWPNAARDLGDHYRAVSNFVAIAAANDDLGDAFPLWPVKGVTAYPPGPQGAEFLKRLKRRRDALAKDGVVAGRARLAFQAESCRACGLCLYGCPYGLIFNAAAEVEKLKRNQNFSYETGLRVVRFEDDESGVRLIASDAKSGERTSIEGARLFVGSGVLPTARIVLNSLAGRLNGLALLDSQQALMPMLHSWAPPVDLETAPSNALAQAFIEINDKEISPWTIHGQVYAYNDLYKSDLRLRFGMIAGPLHPLIAALSRRLLVLQLFAHSDHCGKIRLNLVGPPGDARLAFSMSENVESKQVLLRAAKKLARVLMPLGVVALPPQMRLGAVGSSFHVGGSLPMSDRPGDGQTDIFGRISGTHHTHIIDASVFPSIPATTITFTVMANAHRIGADAPL